MNNVIFKKDELRILWPFYLYYLLFGLSMMIMPFMVIYFVNLGFSFFQISVILAGYNIGAFLFEIPTGAFADNISRKYSVIIGFVIAGAAVIIIPMASSFYLLLILWVIVGLGMTFVSGAEEAWVIDNLNCCARKDLHHEFFIKSQSITAFGAVFAPLIGAVLVNAYSITILWYVFGIGFIISAIILWVFAKELYKPEKTNISKSLRLTFSKSREAVRFAYRHKTIFFLIIGGVFAGLIAFGEIGWQPYLVNLSMPVPALGILFSAGAAIMIVTPFLSKLLLKFKVKHVLATVAAVRMVLYFSLLFIYPPFFLIASVIYLLDDGVRTSKNPLLQTYFHKFIPQKVRATVVSIESMADNVVFSFLGIGAGALMDIFGPQKILALGAFFGIFAIFFYLKIKD